MGNQQVIDQLMAEIEELAEEYRRLVKDGKLEDILVEDLLEPRSRDAI